MLRDAAHSIDDFLVLRPMRHHGRPQQLEFVNVQRSQTLTAGDDHDDA